MRITIDEVAAKAGVSTATVSRVLAGPGVVTASREARVRQAIAELGYAPNAAARALASSHSRLVGVLAPRSATGIGWALLDALEAALARDGFGMLTALSGRRAGDAAVAAARLGDQGVAGVIRLLGPSGAGDEVMAGRPMVTVAVDLGGEDADIGWDDLATAHGVARVLCAMGHRRVLVAPYPRDAQAASGSLRD